MKPTTTLIMLGLGLLSRAQQARADAFTYFNGVYTTISTPGATILEVHGINDAGQIVGTLEDTTGLHGFIDTDGVFTNLPPGANAKGINNAGQVVGVYGVDQGFLYTNGAFSTFGVPGARLNDVGGINDSGQIVGTFLDNTQFHLHGFIDTNGIFTTIDFPAPGSFSIEANGINDAGQVVGTRDSFTGFRYMNGVFSPIHVPGSQATFVNGINNTGQILGFYADTSGDHGFLYSNGVFTTLTLDVPGSVPGSTAATGINDVGQIVGMFSVPPPPTPEPSSLLLVACGLAGLARLNSMCSRPYAPIRARKRQ